VGRGSRTTLAFFPWVAAQKIMTEFSAQRPPNRTNGVTLDPKFRTRLSFGRLANHSSQLDIATRCSAARQVFGLSYYKAGQIQMPCPSFEQVLKPRPTNYWVNLAISMS
jgi:hypothetical protein